MPSKPHTVDDYIEKLEPRERERITQLRKVLSAAVPGAEEVISYAMPAFKQAEIVCWYAAAKNHYALYVYPRVKDLFAKELENYSGTKSSIHFDYDKAIPAKLVTRIAKESLKQNQEKPKKGKSVKK